jgi:CRP/FNR family transcriptional regulator, cyclic AMP receptor protein
VGGESPVVGGFLGRLAPPDRDALLAAGRSRRYRRGSAVFLEGDTGHFVVLLVGGRVKVVSATVEGAETILSVRGPGDLVGELSAIVEDGAPRSASVIAIEPVAASIISATEFRGIVEARPAIAVELVRTLAGHLRHADRRRVDNAGYSTTRRLARLVVELAVPTGLAVGRPVTLTMTMSQQELAGLVGASRESVVRALSTLRQRGLVETSRRSVTVRDIERLRDYVR